MKKNIFTAILILFCTILFAQKVIVNPEYGFNSFASTIEKIELLDTTTIIHFRYKAKPRSPYSIPKKTYIKDSKVDEKLYVTKAEGRIKIGKWQKMPESGVIAYKLFFPKLANNVKTIDFGEDIKNSNWNIYDIVLDEDYHKSLLPKKLRGNWLLADGSNKWEYGFNSKNAIIDRAIWSYKSVDFKGKKYTIVLEREGITKTIYAKQNKNGLFDFGTSLKKLKTYSLKTITNSSYKIQNDTKFTENMFRVDSTTYSGVIKGFSKRLGQKTGTLHVNNVFTGNQDSHLIRIANDGSFSVTFPISYPQSIFVDLPGFRNYIFVEQGKETFHFVNNRNSFFMGDSFQINSDLQKMNFIDYDNPLKTRNTIGVTSPENYKANCFNIRDKELKALDSLNKSQFISAKAFQIKKNDIEYDALENIFSYNMIRSDLKRRNESAKTEKAKRAFDESFKIEKSYYNFIPKENLNNKLAVLSSNYNSYINRLMYADIFRGGRFASLTTIDIAKYLQKENKKLSLEELQMAEMSKEVETSLILAKKDKFREVHGDVEQAFYRKYANDYVNLLNKNKEKTNNKDFRLNLADYVIAKGDTLSSDELKMIEAVKGLKTPQELEKERAFNKAYGKIKQQFYKNNKDKILEINRNNYYSKIDNKIYDFFGTSESYMFDIIRFQRATRRLDDFNIYTKDELKSIQETIQDPFVSNYLAIQNEKTRLDIEANKIKGSYTVNTVNNAEGDELFNSMLKKFKGKVVYVDFWATWCGPCKSGIKRIKPLKEEMKDENVVFLYITNQTSPEKTWKNSIPNIKGEHYRVSKDEWNYLSDKFKITGIPHYVLVNKKGEVVKPKMGHNNNNALKVILEKEIEL